MARTATTDKSSKKTKTSKVEEVEIIVDDVQDDQLFEAEDQKYENIEEEKSTKQKKTKEPLKAKSTKPTKKVESVVVNDWVGDDVSIEEIEPEVVQESEESENENTTNKVVSFKSGKSSRQPSSKFVNSVTNFSYQTYTDLNKPVHELSNKDLVKILIVRAYGENQHDFCRTMKTVLRAMNLECPMPGTRQLGENSRSHPRFDTNTHNQTSHNPNTHSQTNQISHNSNSHNSNMYSSTQNNQTLQNPNNQRSRSVQRGYRRSTDPHDF